MNLKNFSQPVLSDRNSERGYPVCDMIISETCVSEIGISQLCTYRIFTLKSEVKGLISFS